MKKITTIFYIIVLLALSVCVQAMKSMPLSIQDAFQVKITQQKAQTIIAMTIAKNHYIYQKKTYLINAENQKIAPITLPRSSRIHLPGLDSDIVYTGKITFIYPLIGHTTFFYQGCSAKGFCYPPQKIEISSQQKKTNELHMVFFYFYGLLMAFTPCLLPLLPVLSAMIIKKQHTSTQAFGQAMAYVLGISCSYALMGLIFATLGTNLQVYMQHTWAIIITSLVYFFLGLSLLGIIPFPNPGQWFQAPRLNQTHTPLLSFALGALSILVLSPCITPALFAALTLVSQQGHQVQGTLSLFLLGLGVGTPLVIISVFGQRVLPKNGPWLTYMTHALGLIIIIISVLNLSKIMPYTYKSEIYLGCATLCFILFCFKNKHTAIKIALGLSLLLGYTWLMHSHQASNHLPPKPPQPVTSLSPAIVKAQIDQSLAHNKPILIQFTANWCEACQSMEQSVFSQTRIKKGLKDVTWIRVDLSQENENNKALMKSYQVIAPPTFIWIWKARGMVEKKIMVGAISASVFLDTIKSIEKVAK